MFDPSNMNVSHLILSTSLMFHQLFIFILFLSQDFKSPVFIATERNYHNIVKVLLGRENDLEMEDHIL